MSIYFNEFYITDGEDEIDLMMAPAGGIGVQRDGIPTSEIDLASYYRHLTSEENLLFVENWTIVIKEDCPDDFATLSRKLFSMLIKAWLYRNTQRYKEKGPVYIKQRVRGETNARWARVFSSPILRMMSPMLNQGFELETLISDIGIPIARFAWEDGLPGTIPLTKNAFDKTVGGADSPTLVPVANHYDDHAINLIYQFDASGPTYTAVTASAAHNIFPAAPAAGDIYYIGGPSPFWHVIWNLVTKAVATGLDLVWEYSDGGAGWPALTYGDNLMLYPEGDEDDFFSQNLGTLIANFHPGDDWATEAVNGQTRYWVRIRINAMTTFTTAPANGTYLVYNQNQPYAIMPASEIGGDVPPLIRLRMLGADGGDDNVNMCNISRILIGAKSRNIDDGEFDSHLNPGGDGLPTGWVATYGDDTATQVDPEAAGGDSALCDFSSETANVMRVRFTGTAKAEYYVGKYRPFVKCQQIGGDDGDVIINLRIRIDGTNSWTTQIDGTAVALEAADAGSELVDLAPGNYVQIPFGEFYEADSLAGADLILEIFAEVAAGSAATVEFYELVLLPVDEWWGEYEDPITNSDSGSSALRGMKVLIDDGGLVEDRCGMFILEDVGGEEWTGELWERHGKPPFLNPLYGDTYRLHFIMAYFNATWGGTPMLSQPGVGLAIEWQSRNMYLYLRGDD